MVLPNIYSLFLSFSIVSTKGILLFVVLKYMMQKNDTKCVLKFEIQQLQNTIFILIFVFIKYKFGNNTK